MANSTLSLSLAAALAAFAVPCHAQVTEVPGSGCATSTYPQHNGNVGIGQQFEFNWTCFFGRTMYAALGSASGGGLSFGPPLVCGSSSCLWFPGTIGGDYLWFPSQFSLGTPTQWTLDIPNDSNLISTTWAIQCACSCP